MCATIFKTSRSMSFRPILLALAALATSVASTAAQDEFSTRADEVRYVRTSERADLYEPTSLKLIGKLKAGIRLKVEDSFVDKKDVEWFVVTTTNKQPVRGYVRSSQCTSDSSPGTSLVAQADQNAFSFPEEGAEVTQMGLRLLSAISKENANPVISPYGVWSNARLWLRGARGDTKRQLEEVFGFDGAARSMKSQVAGLVARDVVLKRPEVTLTETYAEFAKGQNVSLQDSVFDEEARIQLNAWIDDWTDGRIQDFYRSATWNPDTVLLALNVICIDALWQLPFDKKFTSGQPFERPDGSRVQAAMMYVRGNFAKIELNSGNAIAVVLPCTDPNICAVALIASDPSELQIPLDSSDVTEVCQKAASALTPDQGVKGSDCEVYLPRFSTQLSVNLYDLLNLGRALTGEPDFSSMTESPVKINDMRQTISLEVNELGTYAAAATTTGFTFSAGKSETIRFDRPFLFLLVHAPSQTPLFIAKVTNPEQSE